MTIWLIVAIWYGETENGIMGAYWTREDAEADLAEYEAINHDDKGGLWVDQWILTWVDIEDRPL